MRSSELTGKSGGELIEAAAADHPCRAVAGAARPDARRRAGDGSDARRGQRGGRRDPQIRGAAPQEAAAGEAAPVATADAQLAGVYGALATGCGYPYRVIDAMTLAEAEEIFAYWAANPPAHLMMQTIAAMLGWKPFGRRTGSTSLPLRRRRGWRSARRRRRCRTPIFDIDSLRAANRSRAAAQRRSE